MASLLAEYAGRAQTASGLKTGPSTMQEHHGREWDGYNEVFFQMNKAGRTLNSTFTTKRRSQRASVDQRVEFHEYDKTSMEAPAH